MKPFLLLTCEHATKDIPHAFQPLFSDMEILNTHWSWDIGALQVAKIISDKLSAPLIAANTSRLLIDFNRSLHHPKVFSKWTRDLNESVKKKIIREYYLPYRQQVKHCIEEALTLEYKVIHISVHSFTPELGGVIRNNDVGFLYDPKRSNEKLFCYLYKKHLLQFFPTLKIRFNYPYLGIDDGLTRSLRKEFSSEQYTGIELEINQRYFIEPDVPELEQLTIALITALQQVLAE